MKPPTSSSLFAQTQTHMTHGTAIRTVSGTMNGVRLFFGSKGEDPETPDVFAVVHCGYKWYRH